MIDKLERGCGMNRKILLCLLTALLLLGAGGFLGVAAGEAKWPEGSSNGVQNDGKMKVDVSHANQGYFMAAVTGTTKHRLKLRVVMGDTTMTYDLNGDGDWEVFPLQLGSGKYTVALYENVSSKNYASAGKITLNVDLDDENAAFLYPNQYVSYTRVSEAVAAADKLCAGLNEKDSFKAVRQYIIDNFAYDYLKSVTAKSSELPDIDGSFKKQMGLCQDLSAIMVCMLRTQGIPSKLMIGYADKNYHAWTVTVIEGREVLFDPTVALNAINKPSTYSIERYY